MNFNFQTIKVDQSNPAILIVTLHRPEVRNAINSIMMTELSQLWGELLKDSKQVRCIILTGEGQAFSAGADLKERKELPLDRWKTQHAVLVDAIKTMLQCPWPIIAAVNGAAFGGGLELVLASDFSFASTHATFGQSEVKIGLIPGALGTQHLPRVVGLPRAKELIFTGRTISAKEALTWGIVNQLFEPDQLMNEVLKMAEAIAKNAPLAVKEAKKALNFTRDFGILQGYNKELECYHFVLETEDRMEGIRAFNEKRQPIFKGT
jgi:enoyl-CoA hydratase